MTVVPGPPGPQIIHQVVAVVLEVLGQTLLSHKMLVMVELEHRIFIELDRIYIMQAVVVVVFLTVLVMEQAP
jgi:hypothetical protein